MIEAIRLGDAEVCRVLLDRGADAAGFRGGEGLNAVELAWCHGKHPKVMKQPSWDVNFKKNTSSIVGYSRTNINWIARICCIKSMKCIKGVDGLVGKFT